MINHLTLAGDVWTFSFVLEGRLQPQPGQAPGAVYRVVQPNYFRTMEIGLVKGRDFTDRDAEKAEDVVIINETTAHRYWPNEDPIGKRIKLAGSTSDPGPWLSIVGVIRDVKQSDWSRQPDNEVYLPYLQQAVYTRDAQSRYSSMTLVIKTMMEPSKLTPAVQNQIWSIDHDIPVSSVMTMEQVVSGQLWQPRLTMLLLGVFAAMALGLAAIGTYGVIACGRSKNSRDRNSYGAGRAPRRCRAAGSAPRNGADSDLNGHRRGLE